MLKYLKIYYVLVALPYVLLLAGSAVFFEPIKRTILSNPIPHLNYAIIVIVLTGGLLILNNARQLVREARILREFSGAIKAKKDVVSLKAMANAYTGALSSILQMVAASRDRSISHQEQAALEHELANTRSSLVRRNALPQYLTGLLVAMGLLGTFIGLLATLADISVLIGSFADIDMNNIDPIQVFRVMIERMKAPMSSMGIAFSTSMFGLLGSIVVGLMMLGIRRLQGDVLSVLTSEIARHIEYALSFESTSFRGAVAAGGASSEAIDMTTKILLRIEERLAEAARVRQRALSAEIDDFNKQRSDMLQVIGQQTEASNNFRHELHQLGEQLGGIFSTLERANGEISRQVSELTVHLAGDAREAQKLLTAQVEEQKKLRDVLDGYNINEWLAESVRLQQSLLANEMEDFKRQRSEVLRALTEQTAASNDFRSDLQQVGKQLGSLTLSMEKRSGEISDQISELRVHHGADAKESHRLLAVTNNNVRSELQTLGSQMGTVARVTEQGSGAILGQVAKLMEQLAVSAQSSQQQLGSLFDAAEKGNAQIAAEVVTLTGRLADAASLSQQQLESVSKEFQRDLKQLGLQLADLLNVSRQGDQDIVAQLVLLVERLTATAMESQQQLEGTGKDLRNDLQQLGAQLDSLLHVSKQRGEDLTSRMSEMIGPLSTDARTPQKLHELTTKGDLLQASEQPAKRVNETKV